MPLKFGSRFPALSPALALGLLASACRPDAGPDAPPTLSRAELTRDAGLLLAPSPTPTPPPRPTYTPSPVPPAAGGSYFIPLTFALKNGECGGPASFEDGLEIEIAPGGQTITLRQPSTGDVTTGLIQTDGTFEATSEKESYEGKIQFVRASQGGYMVRIIFQAVNTFEDAQGCVSTYEVEGENEV